MHKLSQLAIALLTGAIVSGPALSAEKPFVTVNGAAVSQATAEMFIAQGKSRGMPDTPEARNQVREELIGRELLWQEARKSGYDKKPEVASQAEAEKKRILAQAEAARQAVIIRAFVDDFIQKNPVTDAQLKAEYEAMRVKGGETEYKARHILVKSEEEAKAIIAKLKKGEKFEELARQSIDPGSRSSGGDLDWSSPARYVKPFADALVTLKKDRYTETPVKSDFGYHVIRLDNSRPRKAPSFEELRPMMQKEAQQQQIKQMVEDLRAKARIQ
ncbi:MAG: hypothetical protein RJA36_2991 [Pseudomonadota bacterium]|jgi:peptidyl-prolyl cis-trans isomerase C